MWEGGREDFGVVSSCSRGHLWHLATPSTRRKTKKVLKKQVALLAMIILPKTYSAMAGQENKCFGYVFLGQEKGAGEVQKEQTLQFAYMSGAL